MVAGEVRPISNEAARHAAERALDEVLADSFPASDPPSWTLGAFRPEPARDATKVETRPAAARDHRAARGIDIIDVSLPPKRGRGFLRELASVSGAVGIALLAPLVIVLAGVPVSLIARGIAGAVGWLFAR